MISYEPLFKTMQKKGITEYNLIYKQGMSANTIHRIKKGLPFTTETLDTLCFILDCGVSDILQHDKTKWKLFQQEAVCGLDNLKFSVGRNSTDRIEKM